MVGLIGNAGLRSVADGDEHDLVGERAGTRAQILLRFGRFCNDKCFHNDAPFLVLVGLSNDASDRVDERVEIAVVLCVEYLALAVSKLRSDNAVDLHGAVRVHAGRSCVVDRRRLLAGGKNLAHAGDARVGAFGRDGHRSPCAWR